MRTFSGVVTNEGGIKKGGDKFSARKRFGQNFLIDRNVLSDIVERSGVCADDVVLEVGPGQGVLTRALLARGCRLHAVELDERLRPYLEEIEAAAGPQLTVHWQDAVKADIASFEPFPSKAVANIPYNITTPLIWRLLEFAEAGLRCHLYMVQKEAADRLMAKADTKARYPLGVTLEVMGAVSLVRRVSPECFRPVPKVDSAVIEIKLERNFHLMRDRLWSDMLHRAFAHRRKTLANNMKGFLSATSADWAEIFAASGISGGTRAEDLEGEEWLKLYEAIRNSGASRRIPHYLLKGCLV